MNILLFNKKYIFIYLFYGYYFLKFIFQNYSSIYFLNIYFEIVPRTKYVKLLSKATCCPKLLLREGDRDEPLTRKHRIIASASCNAPQQNQKIKLSTFWNREKKQSK